MLLTTKLFTPRRQAAMVTRPRLIDRLNEGSSERLILVSGPAGFGKTTLVAQWIDDCSLKIADCNTSSRTIINQFAWLALDDHDNDPVRFLTYLVAALQGVEPGIGHTVDRLLQAAQPPAFADLITILLNEITQVATPFVLVLDDYHVIHTAAIQQAISFLVEHMPPAMHLVILTRADPPLPLSRWRVRRLLTEIREHDLRFTADEVIMFLEQTLETKLSCTDVTALTQRTEGWIAGLQLAALSMAGRSDLCAFIQDFTGSHAYIVDYLTEEVLQRQTAEIQEFLLKTSILDRLCAPLCDAVVGQVANLSYKGQTILEQLERANLFLIPLDSGRRWYRYHHLFADVLRRSLQQRHPTLVAWVHERASLWFEQHGLVGEAVQHALASGKAERAAALVELGADRLLKCGESVTLSGWIDRLPVNLVSARPRLCLARAKTYMLQHQVDAAERTLQGLEHAIQADNAVAHAPGLLGQMTAMRADIALNRNDLPRTIELAHQALANLPPDDLHMRADVLLFLGIAYHWRTQYQRAVEVYAEASQLATRAGHVLIAVYAPVCQAQVLHVQGFFHQAAAALRQVGNYAAEQGVEQLPLMANYHVTLAELLYEWNDLESAALHIKEGIQQAQRGHNPRTLVRAHAKHLRLLVAQRGAEEAHATAEQIQCLIREHAYPIAILVEVTLSLAHKWLGEGNLAAVADWVVQRGLEVDDPVIESKEHQYTVLARLLVARGEYRPALRLLERIVKSAEKLGKAACVVEALAFTSVVLHLAGDHAGALHVLERSLTLAQPEGYIRTFVDEGEPLRLLIVDLGLQIIKPGSRTYIDRLLTAFRQSPVVPPFPSSIIHRPSSTLNLVESLSERELEVLRLVAAGYSDRQIADELVVVVGTAKRHLNNIYGKLSVHSRTQALARAREFGFL